MSDWISEAEAACEAATDNWQLTKATDKSAEINRYGFYVFKGMWGAVAVCPKESPQFGAHKNNMEFIALARTALPRALKELREERAKNEKAGAALRAADELAKIAMRPKMYKKEDCDALAQALSAYREAISDD